MLHGCLHRPSHPALLSASPYRVGATSAPRDWLSLYPAEGDILDNDVLSLCCEAADFRLLQLWKAIDGEQWRIPLDLVTTRYEAIGGWNGVIPGNDPGSIPQADCFAMQAVPLVDDKGRAYPATWHSVTPPDMADALRQGPLLGTIGLTEANKDDPDLWHLAPSRPFIDFHRVLAGFLSGGMFTCRTYGMDVPVHPTAFVAADLMVRG